MNGAICDVSSCFSLEKNKIGDSGAELLADVLNSLLSLKMLK